MEGPTTRYQVQRALRGLTRAVGEALNIPEPDVIRLAVEGLSIKVGGGRVSDAWYAYCRKMRADHGIHPGEQDSEGRQGLERLLAAAQPPTRGAPHDGEER